MGDQLRGSERNPIGEGRFKQVFEHPADPEQVLAEFKEPVSDENIKTAFYMGKLMHLLFPENVPEVHMAGNKRKEDSDPGKRKTSRIVAERIKTSQEEQELAEFGIKYFSHAGITRNEIEKAVEYDQNMRNNPAVTDFIARLEAKGFFIDENPMNFSIDGQGVVKYVEINPAWQKFPPSSGKEGFAKNFDEQKLRTAIENMPEGEDKGHAKAFFERLVTLSNAEEEELRKTGKPLSYGSNAVI